MRTLAALTSLLVTVGLSPAIAQLAYVDASPSGPAFPEWDGGDTELEFGDINSDGCVDFVSIGDHGSPHIGTDQHGVMVYFGDGAGGWSIHMSGNFGYGGIAVGDVNNDGLIDVGYGMHHDYSSTDFGNQLIEVALGDGTGTAWTPWDDGLAQNGEDWGMCATDFADIDADGDLDLASNSFGASNGVHVYRNNGDGTWTQTWARTGGNAQAHLCFGDVNGDGFPDLAASYQYGTIFLGNGEGLFTSADTGLPDASSIGFDCVSLGDVDGDGCADLAFVQSEEVAVYAWRSDHWEPASTGLPTTGFYGACQLCDMNADGDLDLAAFGDGRMTVWLGDGTGQWTEAGGFDNGPAGTTAAFRTGGDIDHNGFPDVVNVQREGSWPSYQNHLYAHREASVPTARWVAMQYPRGGETFYRGSVQTIRWTAAHLGDTPASFALELSTDGAGGPWSPIADHLPDGGHYQWVVGGGPTTEAYIRGTLTQGGQNVSAITGPFTILPSPLVSVDAPATERIRFRIEPNPARAASGFRIQAEGGADAIISIYDAAGRRVGRQHDLSAGTYWVTLRRPGSERVEASSRLVIVRE